LALTIVKLNDDMVIANDWNYIECLNILFHKTILVLCFSRLCKLQYTNN